MKWKQRKMVLVNNKLHLQDITAHAHANITNMIKRKKGYF